MWVYIFLMARAATTTDVFNAVAEARRREILELLAQRERGVGELVASMRLAQPLVSKHLRVLREVGLVSVRDVGRQRLYRVNGQALRPLDDWIAGFRVLWEERFAAMDEILAAMTGTELTEENDDGDH